jgi:hypothetical protein
MTGARFPHSEIPGSTLGCQLPGAYRRLPRPSSAPGAKASTVRPKKLDTRNYKLRNFDARVHYAVLKTRTEPPHTHHRPPTPDGENPTQHRHRMTSQTGLQQTPTTPTDRQEAPEKPERMNARSLRTQQCARTPSPPPAAFLNPTRQYSPRRTNQNHPNNQCSTPMSRPTHDTNGRASRPTPTPGQHRKQWHAP